MRHFLRKGTIAAATAIALAGTGTVAGGAAYVMTEGRAASGAGGLAVPPRPASSETPVATVVPHAAQPASLKRIVPPDFLVIAGGPVAAETLGRVSRLAHVRDVITADGGAVRLQDGQVNMFAVDPERFRSWTPPGTAKNTALWTALAGGGFVVSADVGRRFGLHQNVGYPIAGRTRTVVTMGGTGSIGLPGISVLVGREIGNRLGLVRDIALLVNAPGADLNALGARLRALAGADSQVINLHERRDQAPRGGGASAGKAESYLALYRRAATTCPGLSWTILAAIGQIESDHGRNAGPSGAGALGPMQFLPATWRRYGVDGDGDGKADIMDPYDAVPAAAGYLCASGAGGGAAGLARAIWAYNHSQTYVNDVLALARAYAHQYS